ncbi:MAG TPA: hypothetical protein VIA06_21450 [Candidatus Dormibacteraeota bacterium]|nr:hypothetical protein [Candidatus Dormibacteraeota bacterium]
MTELVDLPDPKERPLVHPLDLPEASRLYRTSWLIGTLTNASIALCISAILWYIGRDYIGPVSAFIAIVAGGALARSGYEHRAWEFIPRKRQDRERPLPIVLELASALVLAAVLAAALVLITLRLHEGDIIPGVRDFIFGMGIAACLIALGELIVRLARRVWWRRALKSVPAILALIGCTAAADAILFGGAGPASTDVAIYGAASMLLIGAVWGVWTLWDQRRQRAAAAPVAAC